MQTPLGHKLRILRAEKGITQKDMAEKLSVTPAFLSAIETGKKKMPNSMLEKLQQQYNVDARIYALLRDISASKLSFKTNNMNYDQRLLLYDIGHKITSLSFEDLDKILSIIRKG